MSEFYYKINNIRKDATKELVIRRLIKRAAKLGQWSVVIEPKYNPDRKIMEIFEDEGFGVDCYPYGGGKIYWDVKPIPKIPRPPPIEFVIAVGVASPSKDTVDSAQEGITTLTNNHSSRARTDSEP